MKIKRGSTNVRRLIFIGDSSSTTGAGLANLTSASAGLVCWYFAGDLNNDVQVTLVSGTLGTYTSGGFVAVDNTNMPGWYEIGIPNAALDGGNEVAIQLRGATNMVPVNVYIELDSVDYQDSTAFGLSRLDASISSRSTLDATGVWAATTRTITGGTVGTVSGAVTSDAAGIRSAIGLLNPDLGSRLDAITDKADEILSTTNKLDTALQIDGPVWQFTTNALENGGGLDAAGVRAAVGLASDNLDTQLNSLGSTLVTIGGYIDTEVAAIKAKTDNLPSDPADQSILLDAINGISVGGAGTGARTVTITVNFAFLPLQGATVRLTKGAESFTGETNVSGQVVFNVNDGTWGVGITAAGATFAGASLVVDGNEAASYSMTANTITPSDPGKRTGYLVCYDEEGQLEQGASVTIICYYAPSTGLALDSEPRTEVSGADGVVSFTNLIVGAKYYITRGSGRKQSFTVPSGSGSVALNSIVGKE